MNAISDGYHTFNELYDHRCLLYINLCLMLTNHVVWKPDPQTDGWFLLYLELSTGQISYHIPTKFLSLVEGKIMLDPNHKWDGHKSKDVVDRLLNHARAKM